MLSSKEYLLNVLYINFGQSFLHLLCAYDRLHVFVLNLINFYYVFFFGAFGWSWKSCGWPVSRVSGDSSLRRFSINLFKAPCIINSVYSHIVVDSWNSVGIDFVLFFNSRQTTWTVPLIHGQHSAVNCSCEFFLFIISAAVLLNK